MLILECDRTEYFAQPNETIQGINHILTQKEFHLMDWNNNSLTSDEMIYKRLFKNQITSSSCKRTTESIENEPRKKQALLDNEENHRIFGEYL
jgi:hypothetical protein